MISETPRHMEVCLLLFSNLFEQLLLTGDKRMQQLNSCLSNCCCAHMFHFSVSEPAEVREPACCFGFYLSKMVMVRKCHKLGCPEAASCQTLLSRFVLSRCRPQPGSVWNSMDSCPWAADQATGSHFPWAPDPLLIFNQGFFCWKSKWQLVLI